MRHAMRFNDFPPGNPVPEIMKARAHIGDGLFRKNLRLCIQEILNLSGTNALDIPGSPLGGRLSHVAFQVIEAFLLNLVFLPFKPLLGQGREAQRLIALPITGVEGAGVELKTNAYEKPLCFVVAGKAFAQAQELHPEPGSGLAGVFRAE